MKAELAWLDKVLIAHLLMRAGAGARLPYLCRNSFTYTEVNVQSTDAFENWRVVGEVLLDVDVDRSVRRKL
jgi:hypothetical protein